MLLINQLLWKKQPVRKIKLVRENQPVRKNKLVKKTKETPIVDGRKLIDDTANQSQKTYNNLINIHCDPENFVDLANRLNTGTNVIS